MTSAPLPIATLIEERCRELGLRRSEIAARCGYRNLSKGVRRLEQVLAGNFARADALLRGLPKALKLSPDAFQEATDQTVLQITAEQDAIWRASFRPAAYLLGTTERPSQILFFGITGGPERWLKIPLDLSQPPVSYAAQALAVVRKTPEVKFFGRTTGFVINYTPDHAVRFNLEGRPVETLTAHIVLAKSASALVAVHCQRKPSVRRSAHGPLKLNKSTTNESS